MATILWCYLRNPAFKKEKDYHLSADFSGQANHLGVTLEADIIKRALSTPASRPHYNLSETAIEVWVPFIDPAVARIPTGVVELQRTYVPPPKSVP
jgi:DhnA family fructose-bisphosphate aldolase class Ia